MPELPSTLRIRIVSGGAPMAGAWAVVTLNVTRKNPFSMLAGPSDIDGVVHLAREVAEANVADEIEASPMDYAGLAAWDGTISVEAMNRERFRGVMTAIEQWGDLHPLATEDAQSTLRRYGDALEDIAGMPLVVEASCTPAYAAVIRPRTVLA